MPRFLTVRRYVCIDDSSRCDKSDIPIGIGCTLTARGSKHTGWLLLVLAAALIVRTAAAFVWQQHISPERFHFGDSDSYWVLAQAISEGEPYQYGGPDAQVFRMPGYPILLAGWFKLLGGTPGVLAVRMLSVLLGTLTVGLVYLLGTQLFGRETGLVAAALTAVYPGAIITSVLILSEPPFCALMLLQLILLVSLSRASTGCAIAFALLAGLVGGFATLVRPSWLLFTPAIAVLLPFVVRGATRKSLVFTALLLGMCLPLAPWWVRNARLVRHFVPTTLQVGASLYDGLNPEADGGSDMAFVPEFQKTVAAEEVPPDADIFEYRLDQTMRQAAVDWAKNHPQRAVQLAGIKFLRLWNVWPNAAEFGGWIPRLLVTFSYVPLLVLGIVGVWRFRHLGFGWMLLWLPAAYFTALHVVFVSSLRYREPAMLTWIVLAAAVLVAWRSGNPVRNGDLNSTYNQES